MFPFVAALIDQHRKIEKIAPRWKVFPCQIDSFSDMMEYRSSMHAEKKSEVT